MMPALRPGSSGYSPRCWRLFSRRARIEALHWAVVVIPILAAVLIAESRPPRGVGRHWILLQAGPAEAIKAEIYRYRALSVGRTAAERVVHQQELSGLLNAIDTKLLPADRGQQRPAHPLHWSAAARHVRRRARR